jgi:hypothetical protein
VEKIPDKLALLSLAMEELQKRQGWSMPEWTDLDPIKGVVEELEALAFEVKRRAAEEAGEYERS